LPAAIYSLAVVACLTLNLLIYMNCMLLSPGANFSLQLRSPCLSDMVEGVLAAESSYEHWGLLHRLQRVLELMDNAEAAGEWHWRGGGHGMSGYQQENHMKQGSWRGLSVGHLKLPSLHQLVAVAQ
jgi:hypothetical protein